MAFAQLNHNNQPRYGTPGELYAALNKASTASKSLWVHQGYALDEYVNLRNSSDVAIELPTGTGKTLVGLLIAHWRLQDGKPVLYAVPTRQLANQVLSAGQQEGIPVARLTGSRIGWDTASEADVRASRSVGVTTYSSIFNSNPQVPDAGTIIVDDAHAADQFIGEAYSLTVNRDSDYSAYTQILEALKPFINASTFRQLSSARMEKLPSSVKLVLPGRDEKLMDSFYSTIATLGDRYRHSFLLLEEILESCAIYVSYREICVRPFIPPTHRNPKFENASHRVYLSATLGSGGELERAFARERIDRIHPTKPVHQGRRFYVFPEMQHTPEPDATVQELLKIRPKALVLRQSSVADAELLAEEISAGKIEVFRKNTMEDEQELNRFKTSNMGLLGLANRFDGLDFPGESCRMTILEGRLDAQNLQEQFLSERVGGTNVLAERVSTRIAQATGRCTRDQNDYSVVVILGRDLTMHFNSELFLNSLSPMSQAEIHMGLETSRASDPLESARDVADFLSQNERWAVAEGAIKSLSRELTQVVSKELEQLESVAGREVAAWKFAQESEWVRAAGELQDAARHLNSNALRGYRAFLLYQASVWLEQADSSPAAIDAIKDLREKAFNAAGPTKTWMAETDSYRSSGSYEYTPADVVAISTISARLRNERRVHKISSQANEMRDFLHQKSSGQYERGLVLLGELLGAKADKPKGKANCDAAWVWGNDLWITLEAKSERDTDSEIPVEDIRQTNTQLNALAAREKVQIPPGSFSVLVSDRQFPRSETRAHAQEHVFLLDSDSIRSLAADAVDIWGALLTWYTGNGSADPFEKVGEILAGYSGLPSQLAGRMRKQSIRNI